MKMKKKVLAAAVAATFGAMGNAHAVNLDSDGLGQVLIMPFYTVQGDNETLITVVNTTDNVKAVKVRFREALNSADALDFNLYLSPHDVWVAKVMDAEGGGAKLFVPPAERTCTVPQIPAEGQPFLKWDYAGYGEDADDPIGYRAPGDTGPYGIERTEAGYVEIIEMGEMIVPDGVSEDASGNLLVGTTKVRDADGNVLDWEKYLPLAPTHVDPETGKPFFEGWVEDCDALVDAWTVGLGVTPDGAWIADGAFDQSGNPTQAVGQTAMKPAAGGLAGTAAVINVQGGVEYSQPVTVLDNFYRADGTVDITVSTDASGNNVVFTDSGVINHAQPGTELPSLTQSQAMSNVFVSETGGVSIATDNWAGNGRPLSFLDTDGNRLYLQNAYVDAVSAVLMAEKVINEYTVNPAVGANTDWVVTFPTKGFYDVRPTCTELDEDGEPIANSSVDWADPNADLTDCTFEVIEPFNAHYDEDPAGLACETYSPESYDRNEAHYKPDDPTGSEGPVFSPAPPGLPSTPDVYVGLCAEANVVSIGEEDFSVFDAEDNTEENPYGIRGTFGLPEGFASGWAFMNLSIDAYETDETKRKNQLVPEDGGNIYTGLPVIGFAATRLANAGVGVGAAYANTIPHRYVRSIVSGGRPSD